MTTNRKKKAFTLTELLVVVIVIGVLSAVVLPKFSKVIETRKTTEAEEMMAFVRTEQERRCALDKPYAKELKDILPNTISKNYEYDMIEGQGIKAESKGKYRYTLKMPSYADGRICCENQTECEKLNKNYPLCSDLVVQADYVAAPESCVAEWSGEELPGAPEGPEGCSGSKPDEEVSCDAGYCGFKKRTVNCENGEWSAGAWDTSGCEAKPDPEPCDCPGETLSYTCNMSRGEWELSGSCTPADECPKTCSKETDHPLNLNNWTRNEQYCCSDNPPPPASAGCCGKVYAEFIETGDREFVMDYDEEDPFHKAIEGFDEEHDDEIRWVCENPSSGGSSNPSNPSTPSKITEETIHIDSSGLYTNDPEQVRPGGNQCSDDACGGGTSCYLDFSASCSRPYEPGIPDQNLWTCTGSYKLRTCSY